MKASPFRGARRKSKLADPARPDTLDATIATLRAALTATEARLQSAAEQYAETPLPGDMRTLYLTYFQWRMGGRRLHGLVRRSHDIAGLMINMNDFLTLKTYGTLSAVCCPSFAVCSVYLSSLLPVRQTNKSFPSRAPLVNSGAICESTR